MNFYRNLDIAELILYSVFLVGYGLYGLRAFRVTRQWHTSAPVWFAKFLLRAIYLSLAIGALLGISFGNTRTQIQTTGKDIYFLMDMSASMNAADVQPSRLEKAKYEMLLLADGWQQDRTGLIVFTDEAFVQCPLTNDRSAFRLFAHTLDSRLMPSSGTNLQTALELALQQFSQQKKQETAQVIILITDGEDFSRVLPSLLQTIFQQGIALFVVGVGTAEGAKIPARNKFKRDAQGNEAISKLNRKVLQSLIFQAKDNYFEINATQNQASDLQARVTSIKGYTRDIREVDVAANSYQYLLALALILLVTDALITVKSIQL
ncbi:MAG: VWA domain-containing protein [Verrucomicrobia bacterium]|nr:VWA domain-containing protein [Cytophagales bacterium]